MNKELKKLIKAKPYKSVIGLFDTGKLEVEHLRIAEGIMGSGKLTDLLDTLGYPVDYLYGADEGVERQ